MITYLMEFFLAVEKMRQCQKKYFLTKTLSGLNDAKACEAAVDACVEKKRAEWDRREREKQPELSGGQYE
jgi:hypothetical protein